MMSVNRKYGVDQIFRIFKSLSEEPEKLLVGEPGLTKDGLDDVFWQVEPFVIGHGDASRSVGMF